MLFHLSCSNIDCAMHRNAELFKAQSKKRTLKLLVFPGICVFGLNSGGNHWQQKSHSLSKRIIWNLLKLSRSQNKHTANSYPHFSSHPASQLWHLPGRKFLKWNQMLQELCETVLVRREDTWNIIFLTMKWKPCLEKEGFFLFKKKEGTGRQSSCGAGSVCGPELVAKFLGRKSLELSPCGNVFTGFTQLIENCCW